MEQIDTKAFLFDNKTSNQRGERKPILLHLLVSPDPNWACYSCFKQRNKGWIFDPRLKFVLLSKWGKSKMYGWWYSVVKSRWFPIPFPFPCHWFVWYCGSVWICLDWLIWQGKEKRSVGLDQRETAWDSTVQYLLFN